MARYVVRCEVEVPDQYQATTEQVEDWARFELRENGHLIDNPLSKVEFEAVAFTVEVSRRC